MFFFWYLHECKKLKLKFVKVGVILASSILNCFLEQSDTVSI